MKYACLLAFLILFSSADAQDRMEESCIATLRDQTKDISFPKFTGKIIISNDSAHFDEGLLVVNGLDPQTKSILNRGLVYPALITAASTRGDGKIQFSAIRVIGTLKIGGFQESIQLRTAPTRKVFSFLKSTMGLANPSLYMFELTNDTATENTSNDDFVSGARVSSFGFCSILL